MYMARSEEFLLTVPPISQSFKSAKDIRVKKCVFRKVE
jgi:hypothetical protein